MDGIRAAIFDMDGTLIDSMGAWGDVDRQFLAKRGLPVEEDYLHSLKSMHFSLAAEYTIRRYHLSETPEEVIAEWRSYVRYAYEHTIPLKEGAREYMEYLKGRGVKIALATSSEEELCLGAMKRLGVYDLIDSVTYTHEAARPKDFPDVYLLAAERIGASPSETAVYEDALKGIKAAKAGGFFTVAVYDPTCEGYWKEMCAEADRAVHDLRELIV